MDDEKREALVAKIKKLLALASNNPSREEATAAALKAQELMAEHDVDDAEINGAAPNEIKESASARFKGEMWAFTLAEVVADGFRCTSYIRQYSKAGAGPYSALLGRQVIFVGRGADAEAAKLTFEYLRNVGNRLADREARRWYQMYGSSKGVRNSYLEGNGNGGFVKGVRDELMRQSRELMLVRQPEVDDYMEALMYSAGFKSEPVSLKTKESVRWAEPERNGRVAGRDTVRAGRLKAATPELVIC